MSTSTILRVKRRREENPQDAIVLMCKRLKTDSEEVSPSLFVFKGSVDNPEEKVQLKSLAPKDKSKLEKTNNIGDIIEKLRNEHKNESAKSRYEVVNLMRDVDDPYFNKDSYNLVDLQKSNERDSSQYIYDLYIAPEQNFDISLLDNLVSIENYEGNLVFGSSRDNGRKSPSSEENESEDSNDENNWRNDYPDTENSSIGEDDMVQAMQKCDIDDLSSDNEEIYSEPPDLVNQDDVDRYGEAYAKYKAKVLSEGKPSLITSCPADYNDSYKSDSDDGFYYGEEQDSEHFRKQYDTDSEPD